MASRVRFRRHGSWLEFRNDSASISLPKPPQSATLFRLDQATITPRSGHDRASIVAWMLRRSSSARMAAIPPRSHDKISSIAARSRRVRGSISPRSWSSSTIFRHRWIELQVMNDCDSPIPWATIMIQVHRQPSD